MKLRDFKLLTDECIHRDVVQSLRERGLDVLDVTEEGLFGISDETIIVPRTVSCSHATREIAHLPSSVTIIVPRTVSCPFHVHMTLFLLLWLQQAAALVNL